MTEGTLGLRDEILEQPAVAARQIETGRESIARVAAALRSRPVDAVVIAARGTSDHAAIYAQYLLGVRHRLPVALATPSILSLYGVVPRFERSLVIGISQSGASPDIVGVVEAARAQGAPTLAITNDPSSPLASAAEEVLALEAGPERAIAATKTYTASLLAMARLSAALLDEPAAVEAIDRVPAWLGAALSAEPEVERFAGERASADRCIVLGRGYEYATAREWALKLKELAQVFADPYSTADFRHGPLALVEAGVPVLAIAPTGRPAADLVELLVRLRRGHGADILVLSDDPATRALGTSAIALPEGVPEWLRPIVSIVPGQLYAYHLTRAKGLDPEVPRNLSKVTLTL